MTAFGPYCIDCGHPAVYHGVTFCMVMAGAETKRHCDCTRYHHPEREVVEQRSYVPLRLPRDPEVQGRRALSRRASRPPRDAS